MRMANNLTVVRCVNSVMCELLCEGSQKKALQPRKGGLREFMTKICNT